MSKLEDLLQQCTVKLILPSGGWGTGFFVAPGLILTCAHVVRKAQDGQVNVFCRFQEIPLSASVQEMFDDGKTLDIALLALVKPWPNHPCVLLDEAHVAIGQELYSYGYLKSYPNAAPVHAINEGLTGDTPPLLKFKEAQIEGGLSGGALINLSTGKACGMVKETRGSTSDTGGGAIPTHVILERLPELRELQQEFHRGDQRWSGLISQSSEMDFQPYLKWIATTYEKWETYYTPTNAEGKQQRELPFDFGLMVQTVKQENRELHREEKVERFSVLEGLRKYAEQQVLLVGRPGSGKSTALARLLLEEAALTPSPSPNAGRGGLRRIPILVELRYWQGSIEQLILDSLTRRELRLTQEQLETVLSRSLILFDGVNELPSEEARSQLAAFRRNHSKLPMIFTSRDLSLGGDLGIEKKLEMQPLTESQMQAFIRAYVPEQAEQMIRQLKDRLRELGQTPLLLWMLCEVFKQAPENQLPSNLAEVFQAFTAMYENSSVRKHEVALLKGDVRPLSDRRLWKKALKTLAFTMMQGETPVDFRVVIHRDEAERELGKIFSNEQFPVRDILDDLLKYHLLQNHSVDQIEFRHQLIQEYYAAEALLERLSTLSDAELQQQYLNYLKWTEPVALILALVEEMQAIRVVKLAVAVDLMLGARLAGEVDHVFLMKVQEFIKTLDVPGWLRDRLLQQINPTPSLPEIELDIYRKKKPKSISDEKIIEICSRISSQNHETRWQASQELGNLTFWGGNNELKILVGQKAIPRLLHLIDHIDPDVRWCVAHSLLIIGDHSATRGLLKLLQDSSDNVRKSAALALGKIRDENAISGLLEFLKNPSSNEERAEELCKTGFNALSQIGGNKTIIGLLPFLESPDENIRWYAVDALGNIEDKATMIGLISGLRDCSSEIRRKAAYELSWNGDERAIPELINHLHCIPENPIECDSIIYALGEIGHRKAIPGLRHFLERSNGHLKEQAILALGKVGDESVVSDLIYILKNSDFHNKTQASIILGRMNVKDAAPHIVDFLVNEAYSSMTPAMEVLDALKKFKHDSAAHVLPKLSTYIYTDAGDTVLLAMQGIQANCKFYNYEIHQAQLTRQNEIDGQKTPEALLQTLAQEVQTLANQPKNDFSGANFNAPVNFGDKPTGDFIGTQHNYAPSQNQTEAAQKLNQLLNQLRPKYPNATEAELFQILINGFNTMPTKNSQAWQRWQDIFSVVFSGGVEATKILVPIAGIPIEVFKRLYEIYDRNRQQLPGA